MLKTYHGSCHCGAVKFEADIDLSTGTGKCNCSFCAKSRAWGTLVKPEAFRLLTDRSAIGDYQFATRSTHHQFCKNCGLRVFSEGYVEEIGGAYVSINLPCLDDLTPAELAGAPLTYYDGLDNNWYNEPQEIRHL